MYEELVKALRVCEEGEHCDLCQKWDDKQNGGMNVCQTAICKEAADAIESLEKENRFLKMMQQQMVDKIPMDDIGRMAYAALKRGKT